MSDAESRLLRARLERGRALPHRLSAPRVDWSPHANRRRGWRPSFPLRNPHAVQPRREAAAPGTPRSAAGDPDTVRVAFIRIDFLYDRGGEASSGDGRFDLSGPDTLVPPIDRPPHNRDFYLAHLEALRRYYDAESYGRAVVTGDVWPRDKKLAYSCTDMADFGPWKFSPDIYRQAVTMFRTMMFAADSQSIAIGDRIPWDTYDRFVLIHAGSDFQSDLRQDSPLDIPSFTIGVEDSDVVIFPDSTTRPIDRAAIIPETINQDGFFGAINGVLAHENGHNLFGFGDVYNTETGYPVVGEWSLMDSGNLVGTQVQLTSGDVIFAVGLLPPSVDPFHRFFTSDLLSFEEVAYGDTMPIRESERHPDMRRVSLSSDEYLVLENRRQEPSETVELDQDSTTRVILGPKSPDRYEYDALLSGDGLLVWHIDASVIPFETAFRPNPDFGFNSNPNRPGISIIEADGLGDLGDPSSPFILGSPYDPYFRTNNPSLSDTTTPNLRPHIRTLPHIRLDFLDDQGPTMNFSAARTWQLRGWPVATDFPPGGPQLLAVDADGDRSLEVCWAGGADGSPDSAALFAVRTNGQGLFGRSHVFASLDRRPRPLMAALPLGESVIPSQPAQGPAYFAASTYAVTDSAGIVSGGQVWLVDHFGQPVPGWPATLPAPASTPPVIAGGYPNASIYVGAADGRVYALDLAGQVRAASDILLGGGVSGRLAVDRNPLGSTRPMIAAGGARGDVAVLEDGGGVLSARPGWPRAAGGTGFEPDFLWIDFDGNGTPAGGRATCGSGERALIVQHADRLSAYCPEGTALPGWGRALADTLVPGLGAGDPDGDGYGEVLTQSTSSAIAFFNQSGYPSPGWPRRATSEGFRTASPPLVLDVDGDGRAEVVGMNASGILAAFDGLGRVPQGWPLATGSGAVGAAVAADLDRNGSIEIVAPDRWVPDSLRAAGVNGQYGMLYAYSVPAPLADATVSAWTMVGGDPGRTCVLAVDRTATAPVQTAGPLVSGSLKAFPNPARRRPVAFAYQLTEPAEVEFSIIDPSGHAVASFTRSGRRADNLETWDPGNAPAGLYLARLRFRSSSGEHSEVVTVGLLR